KVKRAGATDVSADLRDRIPQQARRFWIPRVLLLQRGEQRAKRALAIGVADRQEPAEAQLARVLDRAVVRERERASPQLAHERMRVRELYLTARLLTHVCDREQRLDRIRADVTREGRARGRVRLEKRAHRGAFVQREPPTVPMWAFGTTAQCQARKRE